MGEPFPQTANPFVQLVFLVLSVLPYLLFLYLH